MSRKRISESMHRHLKQAKRSFKSAQLLLEDAREQESRGRVKEAEVSRSLAGICQRTGQQEQELAEKKQGGKKHE